MRQSRAELLAGLTIVGIILIGLFTFGMFTAPAFTLSVTVGVSIVVGLIALMLFCALLGLVALFAAYDFLTDLYMDHFNKSQEEKFEEKL